MRSRGRSWEEKRKRDVSLGLAYVGKDDRRGVKGVGMRLPVFFGDGESERHIGGGGACDVSGLGSLRVTGKNWGGEEGGGK